MPPIPTINSSASVATGSTGPRADASSFGGGQGLAALGQGMSNLGAGVSSVGVILKQREKQDAEAWNVQAKSQYVKELSAFTVDEENQSSPTYAQDFEKFSAKLADDYLAKAPNNEAAKSFKTFSVNSSTQYYLQAQSHAERLRLTRLQSGVGDQVTNVMAEFRANLQTVGDGKASIVLSNRVSMLLAGAEDTFGGMPETLAKVESDIYESVIIGSMEDSPELARDLLDQAPFDEKKRKVLEAQIDSAVKETNYADQIAFDQANTFIIERAKESGDIVPEIPISTFQAVYGDERKSLIEFEQYDFRRRSTNFKNTALPELRGRNLQVIQQEMTQIKDAVLKSGDLAMMDGYSSLTASVKALTDELTKDGASYVSKYNPYVQRQGNKVLNAPINERAAENQKFLRMIRDYQGYPPEGTPEDQKPLYLGLPTQRQHVLTEEKAKDWVDRFTNSTLSEQYGMIDQFEGQFEDMTAGSEEANSKMFSWIFSDLVSLGGLPQEVQTAFMVKDNPGLVRQIIGSTENQKAIASLNPEKIEDYGSALMENEKWQAFQRTRTGSNQQNAPEVSGFAKAIRNVALSLNDPTPEDSVDRAVEKILGSKLGFIEVQDTTIAIPKDRYPGNPSRTDQDITDIQAGLNNLLPTFPVYLLDPNDPRINVGLADNETKQEIQRLAISNGGFWVPTQDGQAMTLYVRPFGPGGTPLDEEAFELTDAQGKPFIVELDAYDVSEYTSSATGFQRGALSPSFKMPTTEKVRLINYNSFKHQGRFR